jgi:hypothetical protein
MDNKELMSKSVASINEYLSELCTSNNACRSDGTSEWMVVRMASLIPVEVYNSKHQDRYNFVSDDLPEGTTHRLMVGIQWWDSDQPDIFTCMSGQIFNIRQYGEELEIEDIADCLGGGPHLTDSTMDECIDWMRELGGTGDRYVMYHDLVDARGDSLALPDSGYSK